MKRINHLGTANDSCSGGPHATLHGINIDTAVASAVVTVYEGTDATGTVRAVIDAATAPRTINFHGARFGKGLFVVLTGGNAKVSVISG